MNKIPEVDDTSVEGFIFAQVSEPLIQHGGEGLAQQSKAVHHMEERRQEVARDTVSSGTRVQLPRSSCLFSPPKLPELLQIVPASMSQYLNSCLLTAIARLNHSKIQLPNCK